MNRRRLLLTSCGCLLLALIQGAPAAAPGGEPAEGSSEPTDLPAWPTLEPEPDSPSGGPVAVRFQDGHLVVLPGARGSTDSDYVIREGPHTGMQHPFTDPDAPSAVLSWNALMLLIGLSTPAEQAQATVLEFGDAASVWLPDVDALDGCWLEDGLTLCAEWPLSVDASGRFSSTGSLEISGTTDGLTVHGTLTGPLWGYLQRWATQTDTLVVVKTRLTGTLEIGGIAVPTTIWTTLSAHLTPDGPRCNPASVEACLHGDLRMWMHARVPGAGLIRSTSTAPFVREVPRDDGRWRLILTAALAGGNRLDGDASVVVGDPETPHAIVGMTLGGRYAPWRDQSQLWLRPATPGIWGSSLSLWGVESELGQIQDASVFFQLFGQRGRLRLSEDDCCTAGPLLP